MRGLDIMNVYSEQREKYQRYRLNNLNDTEKSELIKKMLLFNQLIKLLVKWKKEKNHQTEQEVLKDLSFVPVIKCLYIVCLLSVREERDKSLFDIFDFEAFPKGGVNKDCYYFMDQLPNYTIRENNGVEELTFRDSSNLKDLSSYIETLEKRLGFDIKQNKKEAIIKEYDTYYQMLEDAVNDLKKASNFPGFRERERLIELTHMKIWKDAFYQQDSPTMDTKNKKDILDEAMFLRWNIAA